MNRALFLLLGLRLKGWLRRFGRSMRTVKGIALTVLGMAFFLPWLFSNLLLHTHGGSQRLEHVREYGPLVLLLYCLVTLLFSTGERAISFTPAEVNLLFSGPFHRRELLLYKITASLGLGALSALIMTVVMSQNAAWFLAAYLGMLLIMTFLQLFSMLVALVTTMVGVVATTWRRRLVLGTVAAVGVLALWQVGQDAFRLPPAELLERVRESPAVHAVLSPFRWFLIVFTAERLWPDLVEGLALSLAIIFALMAAVLVLDAQYLEASAAASARLHARLEQLRRGGSFTSLRSSGKARSGLPMLPWWGGSGPVAWRQLTSAQRDSTRLILALLVFGTMITPVLLTRRDLSGQPELATIMESVIIVSTLFLTQMLPFDFRADIDRIAELKVLPIKPSFLVVGQLLGPVLIMSVLQGGVLGFIGIYLQMTDSIFWGIAAFALPFNALMFGIENLVFLWFPTRLVPTNPGDVQVMGRAILLMLAKAACMAGAGIMAGLVAAAAFFLSGRSSTAAFIAGWTAISGAAAGLVPLVALAFQKFDVARDTPP